MKTKLIFTGLCFIFLFGGLGMWTSEHQELGAGIGKKGILVVSFGTSYEGTRRMTIDAIEREIVKSFPDYEVRRAFTSHIIIKIYKKRDNIVIDTPEQALEKMAEEGFSKVIVQSTHLINGAEFHDLAVTVNKFKSRFEKLEVGMPILSSTEDYEKAIDALKQQLPPLRKDQAVVLMGHGTHHPANASYAALQFMLNMEGLNVYVGTVEGYPELDHVITQLKRDGIREVTLMPYMIVAGDHARNDMAGDEEDSWKIILRKQGFKVDVYLHGLGENPGYHDIIVMHVNDAIEGYESEE